MILGPYYKKLWPEKELSYKEKLQKPIEEAQSIVDEALKKKSKLLITEMVTWVGCTSRNILNSLKVPLKIFWGINIHGLQ